MDANGIAMTASAAAALGFGASLGLKLAPAFIQARREAAALRSLDISEGAAGTQTEALKPSGHRRESSIVGLYGDALRHADGSFTRAYHVELAPTIYCDDLVAENRCNALARLLAARKPVGTVIQFRLSTDLDPGLALKDHGQARDYAEIHPLASSCTIAALSPTPRWQRRAHFAAARLPVGCECLRPGEGRRMICFCRRSSGN